MSQHVLAGLRGRAAVHDLTVKTEAMLEPLLEEGGASSVSSSGSDEEDSLYSASTVAVEVKQTAGQVIKTVVVSLGLMVGAAASAGAMVLAPAIAVFIMGGVVIAHVPYSAYKEWRIAKLPTLRSLNNKLREEANQLEAEVDYLQQQINELQPEADKAAVVEAQLRGIASGQHKNVDKLVELVKENDIILDQMRDNVRQRIVQDIVKIVVMSDKNNDGQFCKVETKMLILKISLQLQEYGVEFDEHKFYRAMRKDPSVTRTLAIVKRLIPSLNEDESSEDSEVDEDDDVFDMFHMRPDSSFSTAGSGSPRDRRLSLSLSVRHMRKSHTSAAHSSLSSRMRSSSLASNELAPAPEEAQEPPPPEPLETPERVRKRDILFNALKKRSSSSD